MHWSISINILNLQYTAINSIFTAVVKNAVNLSNYKIPTNICTLLLILLDVLSIYMCTDIDFCLVWKTNA